MHGYIYIYIVNNVKGILPYSIEKTILIFTIYKEQFNYKNRIITKK